MQPNGDITIVPKTIDKQYGKVFDTSVLVITYIGYTMNTRTRMTHTNFNTLKVFIFIVSFLVDFKLYHISLIESSINTILKKTHTVATR